MSFVLQLVAISVCSMAPPATRYLGVNWVSSDVICAQGCAVIVEANQLEYGQRAHMNVSNARSGCFLQPEVMEV